LTRLFVLVLTVAIEEIRALAKANQTSFSLVTAVADRYLDRNGRRYVDMRGLFGFMERIQL
jgi:DNA polymerase alpha subunit A